MSTPLRERFTQFIEYKGIKRAAFERISGLSNGYTRNIKENISAEKLEHILSAFPEINKVWLCTGLGEMINSQDSPSENAQLLGIAAPAIVEETVPVRFFEPNPSATFREFCTGVNETPSTINILPESGDSIDQMSCVFQVAGDSMAPQIQDKAKVLCREVLPSRWISLRHGVIAIVYDDRFVIKRIKKNLLETKNYILLSSDNPEYQDTEKAYLGNIRCVFEVIRVISQRVY